MRRVLPGRLLASLLTLLPLTAACAASQASSEEPQRGSPATRDFLDTCRRSCTADGSRDGICRDYCHCALQEIRKDPSLAEKLVQVEDDPAVEAEVSGRLMWSCGQDMFVTSFVSGCGGQCTKDGGSDETCRNGCRCVATQMLQAHPGPEGISYVLGAMSSHPIPRAFAGELSRHFAACGML